MSAKSPPTPITLQNLSIPRPSSGNLRGLAEDDRPIAVFSDFDGTIFLQDTGHVLFDRFGCGKETREKIDKSIGKTMTFRDASEELWGSLNCTMPQALEQLKKDLVIDPDFYTFFEYLQKHGIPFTVISAGIRPLLRAALDEFLGLERSKQINIVSNDGEVSEDGKTWKPIWIHDSPLGHDKAQSLKKFRSEVEGPQPKVVFIGDGVSDLAAATQADILFARRGLALEEYCIENMIPYIPYGSFKDIISDIKHLVKGNRFHDPDAAETYRRAKLAELTGLAPLTGAPSKPPGAGKFSIAADDEDNSSDEGDDEEQDQVSALGSHIPRPSTPENDPEFLATDAVPPPLSRQTSVGDVPQVRSSNRS